MKNNSSGSTTTSPLYHINQLQHFKEDQMPIPRGLHQPKSNHHYSSDDHFGQVRRNGGTSTTAAMDDAVATQQKQQQPEKRKLQLPVIPEDIDQSAEAFIRKFRQQLVIQRMQSIENYEKMLDRGT